MAEINLLEAYPRIKRAVDQRGRLVTDADRALSREFGKDYFDGDRLHGYGGYRYDGRWQPIVKRFRDHYQLTANSSVLDVGCAKGFMLHDFKQLMPELSVAGIDISPYALELAMPTVKPFLQLGTAKELPFEDRAFDLVICINTVHNLPLEECKQAIREIQRVARQHTFIVVDAWRTDAERETLEQWILTAQTYMHVDDWRRLFAEVDYTGDYYWCIIE